LGALRVKPGLADSLDKGIFVEKGGLRLKPSSPSKLLAGGDP